MMIEYPDAFLDAIMLERGVLYGILRQVLSLFGLEHQSLVQWHEHMFETHSHTLDYKRVFFNDKLDESLGEISVAVNL